MTTEYQYKYLPPPVREVACPGADRMMQCLDTLLDKIRNEKGEFFAFNVAFLVEMRMFNSTLEDETKSLQNSRFASAYFVRVLKSKYGKNYGPIMVQMIEEAEHVSNEVIEA